MRAVALSIGGRYAFSRRTSISFISTVAVLGLALSVGVLVVVVSVINGFERELTTRVFGVLPHVTLHARDSLVATAEDLERLRVIPGVAGAAPFIQGAGLAAVADGVAGVLITGIDPSGYAQVSDLDRYTGNAGLEPGAFEVLLGAGIAKELGVGAGDLVTLVLPSATVTPAGLFPRQKRFRIRSIVRTASEVDGRAAYVHAQDARRLYRLGEGVHGYQLKLTDLFAAPEVSRVAVDALGRDRVYARTWIGSHGNLYRAIGVMKTTMFLLLSFLVAVAAFNLVSTLVMVVDQRAGDIAILRSLGGDTATLVGAFVLLGACLGLAGVGLGLLTGALLANALPGFYAWASTTFALDLMNQYFVRYLPVEVRMRDLMGISATAFALCVLSTIYPAARAAALRPSEVLAHE